MPDDAMMAHDIKVVLTPDGETYGLVAKDRHGNERAIAVDRELAADIIVQMLQRAYEIGGTVEAVERGRVPDVDAAPCHEIRLGGSADGVAILTMRCGRLLVPYSMDAAELRRTGTQMIQLADILGKLAAPRGPTH